VIVNRAIFIAIDLLSFPLGSPTKLGDPVQILILPHKSIHKRGISMASISHPPNHSLAHRQSSLKQKIEPLAAFWMKMSNDWVFQLSDMLAYNFLISMFPLLLVLLAIAGFILGNISPASLENLQNSIANALPTGIGVQVIHGVTKNLQRQAGPIFIVGLILSLFSGSRLFIAIENSSGVIFRLRGRDAIHQNIMALGMACLYIILIPLIFAASVLPDLILHGLGITLHSGIGEILSHVLGIVVGIGVAIALFAAIFIIVPNRPIRWQEVWRGTLLTSILFVLYQQLFPLYTNLFLKPNNYGSLIGFVIVLLVFFYYLSFILLLGMETNSWTSGQRQTSGDVQALFHEVQAHNTTRGAAGPTAGTQQEDIEHREGAPPMSDDQSAIAHERQAHKFDLKPPKYAEANKEEGTPLKTDEE
jgi:membrane protein